MELHSLATCRRDNILPRPCERDEMDIRTLKLRNQTPYPMEIVTADVNRNTPLQLQNSNVVPRQRLLSETLLTPTEAATRFSLSGGRKLHVSGLVRLMMKGAKASNGRIVRLESVRVAGSLLTSVEAVSRFVQSRDQSIRKEG